MDWRDSRLGYFHSTVKEQANSRQIKIGKSKKSKRRILGDWKMDRNGVYSIVSLFNQLQMWPNVFVVSMNENSTRTDEEEDFDACYQCGSERAGSEEGECPAGAEPFELCSPTGPLTSARAGRAPPWTACSASPRRSWSRWASRNSDAAQPFLLPPSRGSSIPDPSDSSNCNSRRSAHLISGPLRTH